MAIEAPVREKPVRNEKTSNNGLSRIFIPPVRIAPIIMDTPTMSELMGLIISR
jgi:hypothetical protein